MKPHLLLLIDGDQTHPQAIPVLLEDLGKDWTITGRVCVRNWRAGAITAWAAVATEYGLDCIHHEKVRSTKNGSDIELAIRAVDFIHEGHQNFCIVSQDSDFLPLKRRVLRGGGQFLWRDPLTGKAFEVHEPSAITEEIFNNSNSKNPDEGSKIKKGGNSLEAIVRSAYQSCKARNLTDQDGYVSMANLGQSPPMRDWRQKIGLSSSVQLRHQLSGISGFEVKMESKGLYVTRLRP